MCGQRFVLEVEVAKQDSSNAVYRAAERLEEPVSGVKFSS